MVEFIELGPTQLAIAALLVVAADLVGLTRFFSKRGIEVDGGSVDISSINRDGGKQEED